MLKLSIQEGYNKLWEVSLKPGETKIGRGKKSDICLEDTAASRTHACLTLQDSTATLEDLNSRNGTYVNGMPVEKVTLGLGDRIQIGSSILVLEEQAILDDASAAVTATRKGEKFGLREVGHRIQMIEENISKVVIGSEDTVQLLVMALMCGGHVLIEDVPGVGKTMMAKALARSIKAQFKRIQFTPDLLPSDVTGVSVFNPKTRHFDFRPGPVFSNIVLADEINRTNPRTQSALLECMAESKITVDGINYELSSPFMVVATQNPIDYQGTYPLPEAQMDRFLMRLGMGYPSVDDEVNILTNHAKMDPLSSLRPVVEAPEIIRCQALIRNVHVADNVKEYVARIVAASRAHSDVRLGCSPRGALALTRAAQARAVTKERDFVEPHDIKTMIPAVLPHRMLLNPKIKFQKNAGKQVLEEILSSVAVP